MAREIHAVVRTDKLTGTDVRAYMDSVRYKKDGELADIDNGSIVWIKDLIEGEREIFEAADMEANTPFQELAIVATPEVMYDERLDDLADFYNAKDDFPQRTYRFDHKNIFSVTKEGLDGLENPAVGNYVNRQAGHKGLVVATKTEGTTFGKIIRIDLVETRTYYVIQLV